MKVTPYQMCINNAARYIKYHPDGVVGNIDIFVFSSVLSACFCKDKEEIARDIIEAENENEWDEKV